MKVCVLSDPAFEDFSPAPFLENYEWELFCVERPAYDFIFDISRRERFDIYFNLCDGALDEDRPGLDVVQALEALQLPFTGADSRFYSPTREQMQAVAEIQGIGFARGIHVESMRDLMDAKRLRYPLIVKHPNSYGSTGLRRESRAETPSQLRAQVERMLALFGGARVEEFIEGREFTCLIVDNPKDLSSPFAYPVGEALFPEGETFQHEDVKWITPTRIVPVTDESLSARIQEMSRKMFLGLGGTGYGRTDIRMSASGGLFALEINPNCAILYRPEDNGPADVPITFDPDGYRGFFERIFHSAVLRQQKRIAIEPPRREKAVVRTR